MMTDYNTSIIYKLLRILIADRIVHISDKKEKNVVWVSDLIRCKLKGEYELLYTELYDIQPYQVLGYLLHMGLEKFLAMTQEGMSEYDVEKEIDGVKITGRIDFLTDDTVYEIKYMRDHRDNKPLEHHVLQTRIYMWMTDRKKGKIIYVTPNRIAEYDITDPMNDDEVRILLEERDKIPRWDWECKYCEWSKICPKAKL